MARRKGLQTLANERGDVIDALRGTPLPREQWGVQRAEYNRGELGHPQGIPKAFAVTPPVITQEGALDRLVNYLYGPGGILSNLVK